jgi:hypothetical protein
MTKKMITETIQHLEVDSILFGNHDYCSIDYVLDNVSYAIGQFKEVSAGYENVIIRKESFGYDGAFNVKVVGERLETDEEYAKRQAAEQKKAERKARAAEQKKAKLEARAANAKRLTPEEAAEKITAMFESDEEMMAILKRLAVR